MLGKLSISVTTAHNTDSYNDVPYEKGYALVCYLRSLVASDDVFDNWIKVSEADIHSLLQNSQLLTLPFFLNVYPTPPLYNRNMYQISSLSLSWLSKCLIIF